MVTTAAVLEACKASLLLLPQLLLQLMHTCIPVIVQAFERSEVIIVCHFVNYLCMITEQAPTVCRT
jgi:hypothetical protein